MKNLIIILISSVVICNSTLTYGRYCGTEHFDLYGARPDDILAEICHIYTICTIIGRTDSFCNYQMAYFSMNHKSTTQTEEIMRQYMISWSALSICISPIYYGDSYDKLIKIPSLNVVSRGFSYYTLFNFDNISHIYYILPYSDYLFATIFVSFEEYNTYAHLAYESGSQFTLHPSAQRLDRNKYTRFTLTTSTIIVISNIKIGGPTDYDFVKIIDATIYDDITEISKYRQLSDRLNKDILILESKYNATYEKNILSDMNIMIISITLGVTCILLLIISMIIVIVSFIVILCLCIKKRKA